MKKPDRITELLTRGVAEVIVKDDLEEKLRSGKKLRVKFGIDPTWNLLHLGHSVALLKLKEFQNLGHTVIFLIGDHTAEIGDPSGRSKERTPLSQDQIKENMASYREQAGHVIDFKKVEVRYNSEWYDRLGIREFADLTSKITIPQILQRADFKKRLKEGGDVSAREAFYPLLQGYDSVMLKADVELGGTDQKFNLLMGRQIQKRYGQKEQDIITVELLEGTDGSAKMSKTADNFIAITESAEIMYGKVMSIPDSLIGKYFVLTTRVPMNEVGEIEEQMKKNTLNPRDAKMHLAREIVTLYHGAKKAGQAEENFIALFQKKELPDDMPTIKLKKKEWPIVDLMVETNLASSKSEARRLIAQKGVVMRRPGAQSDTAMNDPALVILPEDIAKGFVIKRGKRHFVAITS
ncbi:tyrosine--tRNA ligase [Candidatus Uhrbacteria bacterium]|nr:tyrosine--tRNA ligase [Candidatus Uhrbacteria bacterium]